MNHIPTIILLITLLGGSSFAQHRCATTEIQKQLIKSHPDRYDEHSFENWLYEKSLEKAKAKSQTNEIYQIPVVVHVIHNGEQIGDGINLSDEKILEQIDILNKDFRRTNEDSSNTPDEYSSITADTEIEFIMAVRDPEGRPTSGITRTRGTLDIFKFSEDAILKSHINWPPEDYMNIYIADLQGFLGWAQFPVMNLDGLEGEFKTERLTDGVVLDYKYVGLNDNTNSFESFGRTATHEVGHYLGLRHIWGDGGCSFDDYCDDTPFSDDDTEGCPTDKESCGTRDMIENFMDYTHDECMNLFTVCQRERMRIVLENSPRRKSLLSSNALVAPEVFSNDLGVKSIDISASLDICNTTITPIVDVRNYGLNPIDSFIIEMRIDGIFQDRLESFEVIEPDNVNSITFSETSILANTYYTLSFKIIEINGIVDENSENNSQSEQIFISEKQEIPISQDFESGIGFWNQFNFPANNPFWELSVAPSEVSSNTASKLSYYTTSNDVYGNFDYLVTPVVDLTSFSSTAIQFDYAYAPRPGYFTDGLIIAVSTDCGESFTRDNYLMERYGNQLATSSALNQEFTPISENDWRTISLDLSAYSDEENVRIAFIGVNGGGNNIYLDNITISPSNQFSYDVGIGDITNISLVSCLGEFNPAVQVKNFGTETINSLQIDYRSTPDANFQSESYNSFSIRPGSSRVFFLPNDAINNESSIFELNVSSINGQSDEDITNNTFTTDIIINTDLETIPARERFESEIEWTQINDEGSSDWLIFEDLLNKAIYIKGFELEDIGKENWLVGPVLKTQEIEEASISFKVSYAQRLDIVDGLKVLLSTDCGQSWENTIYNKQGHVLALKESNIEWIPAEEDDWRTEFIDLTPYLEEFPNEDFRIAFVATNGNGNNIYIDDIEIYNTSTPNLDPSSQEVLVYPNPTTGEFNVSMNLDKKNDMKITITDIMGKVVFEDFEENVLNQNFLFDLKDLSGLYFIYLKGQDFEASQRIFINR